MTSHPKNVIFAYGSTLKQTIFWQPCTPGKLFLMKKVGAFKGNQHLRMILVDSNHDATNHIIYDFIGKSVTFVNYPKILILSSFTDSVAPTGRVGGVS